MEEFVITKKSVLVDIADAIRSKSETSETLSLDEMHQMTMNIQTGVDTSDVTATPDTMLSGVIARAADGSKVVGNIPNKTSSDLTVDGATVSVPAGHYSSAVSKSVTTVDQVTPSISVDSAGKITASATQTAGYVAAGTKSATEQLTAQAAQTITPGTSNKTIASGRYLTGTQTIKGDANLLAGNIKKGVSIFGVAGSCCSYNLTVVGGTSQPSSPTENTFWVNTSTAINGYAYCSHEPTSPANGMVWIQSGTESYASIDIDDENTIILYPIACKQYISGEWVSKGFKSYTDGAWREWYNSLYDYGTTNLSFSFSTDYASDGYLGADYIHLESTNKYGGTVSMSATPSVDLTTYSTAEIEIENTGSYATVTIGFGSTVGSYSDAYWQYKGEYSKQTITIDITNLNGLYYLSANRITNSDSRAVGITKIHSIYLK